MEKQDLRAKDLYNRDPMHYHCGSIYLIMILDKYNYNPVIPQGLEEAAHYFYLLGVVTELIKQGKIPRSEFEREQVFYAL